MDPSSDAPPRGSQHLPVMASSQQRNTMWDGNEMPYNTVVAAMREYIFTHCQERVMEILEEPIDMELMHFGLQIDIKKLSDEIPILGNLVLVYPSRYLPISMLRYPVGCPIVAIGRTTRKTWKVRQQPGKWINKAHVHVRIINLPECHIKEKVSHIRSADYDSLIQVSGTIVRTLSVPESRKTYRAKAGPAATASLRYRQT